MVELGWAYTRRVQWEARVQAVEIGKVIAEIFGGGSQESGGARSGKRGDTQTRGKHERVSADTLLGDMGVKIGRPAG